MKNITILFLLFMSGCSEVQTVYGCSLQMIIIFCTVVVELVLLRFWLDQYEGTELTNENLMLYHVTRGE